MQPQRASNVTEFNNNITKINLMIILQVTRIFLYISINPR
ncbi:hypothetical protein GJA_4063 [Janthinobacterium agaricidamnosum NBRC 102515 = DSM 9628]|uniref:Uncharacterized protein n=1 Tax=Janthinobacterium agaricidamnosum NBRC 102515 = DSM 9628 TaxID=1349767 RepID=W0VBD9_9BURK|nr:hypothetical protein GJA_4063 [Janthinobacterium agaricidamnosum NBRC 102515 = DSM 9628]